MVPPTFCKVACALHPVFSALVERPHAKKEEKSIDVFWLG